MENVHSKIWKCKENILLMFNEFLIHWGYKKILFNSKVVDIWSKLVKLFIYSQ
jgi:hypothetical protein